MEEILDVYARRVDPRRPLVGFDEGRKELRADVRPPLPATPGHPLRYDTEYSRNGAASLLLWTAPLLGRRGVTVSARRTRLDFAQAIRELVDVQFPEAERIVLVMDNLNTHTAASLYEAFPPSEAKRLWDTLEVHYTPKHGSWLNVAEIELSVLGRQCLDRRIPDIETLATEVAAWVDARNAEEVRIDWHFTTDDARIKLKHLYPITEPVT
jgi:hypothetical protein